MSSMPLLAEDLTTDWLNEVLAPTLDGATIVEFNATVIGVGEGFMGQLARVELTLDNATEQSPKSVIAKFATANDATREMARLQRLYDREIGFYRDIGNDVGISVPNCYYLQHELSTNHFVLLLEDLAPAYPSDQVEGTDRENSRRVIETFAKLHAHWWNNEKLTQLEWAQPLFNAMPIAEGLEMINNSIKQAEETGRFERYPEMDRLMYMLPPLFKMEPPPPFPFTLSHGDLRSDNIFCPSEDGGRFAVIDWQLAGMGQPMTDIARWLTQSISIEDRRETEEELLKLYHQKLVEHGVTDYPFKKMMQEYQLSLVIILLLFTNSMDDIDQTPERTEALFHQMYSRLDAALADHQVVNILKVLPYMIPFMKLSIFIKQKWAALTTKPNPKLTTA